MARGGGTRPAQDTPPASWRGSRARAAGPTGGAGPVGGGAWRPRGGVWAEPEAGPGGGSSMQRAALAADFASLEFLGRDLALRSGLRRLTPGTW